MGLIHRCFAFVYVLIEVNGKVGKTQIKNITSLPLRKMPIERRVLRIARNVLFDFKVSMPCFRSIKGSAISYKQKYYIEYRK